MDKASILHYLSGVIALLILFGIYFLAGAFTSPTQSPPNGNVPVSLNTSSTAQTKQGNLQINGNLTVNQLNTNAFYLGGVLKTIWYVPPLPPPPPPCSGCGCGGCEE